MANQQKSLAPVPELVGDIRAFMWEGSGHSHWDSTQRHGAGCETCIKQREGRDKMDRALTQIIAQHVGLEEQYEYVSSIIVDSGTSLGDLIAERDSLKEQLEAAEKGLREIHEYLGGIVASGFVGEADWDDFNSWLAKHERYATYVSSPAGMPKDES